jgi:hypothetical protein
MATTEEIDRRVKEVDAVRSARRAAAAKRVGELAQRRAVTAEQLSEIERELGDVLAESSDVMEIDELARFVDVPAADLSRWLNGRRASRSKRKRAAGGVSVAKNVTSTEPSTAEAPTVGHTRTPQESPVLRDIANDTLGQVTAEVR